MSQICAGAPCHAAGVDAPECSTRSAPAFDTLIGAAVTWQHVIAQAQQIAATDQSVLIVGAVGSGRTTLARAMHGASTRHAAPLIELDLQVYYDMAQVAALFGADGNGGAWIEAGNGSLLLRSVADGQAIHEALAERLASRTSRVGSRLLVVVSEALPLPQAIAAHIPVRLRVPPLRERPGDALLLANYFADNHPITSPAAQRLESYDWPENVAEMRGVVARAVRLAGDGPIESVHLPEYVRAAPGQSDQRGVQLPPDGINLEVVE